MTRTAYVIAAVFFLVTGAWSFVDPESFFRIVARFPPYNRHLFHDLGAFKLGIGVTLVAAWRLRDSLPVALLGAATAAALHAVSHFMDRSLGGRPTDPYTLLLFAVVVAAGAARLKRRPR